MNQLHKNTYRIFLPFKKIETEIVHVAILDSAIFSFQTNWFDGNQIRVFFGRVDKLTTWNLGPLLSYQTRAIISLNN